MFQLPVKDSENANRVQGVRSNALLCIVFVRDAAVPRQQPTQVLLRAALQHELRLGKTTTGHVLR